MPAYNAEKYISEAIQSVVRQTYVHWELIVVDDRSTDQTKNIVNQYTETDLRIKLITRIADQGGASICRNIGLKHARGEYVMFFDSDDLLADFCLQQRVECMSTSNYDFAVFQQYTFKDSIELCKKYTQFNKKHILYCIVATDNIWQTMAPMYRVKFIREIGGFDESFVLFTDDVLHLKAVTRSLNGFKLVENLPPDSYYRNQFDFNRPEFFKKGSESLEKYISKIVDEFAPYLNNKRLIKHSITSVYTKYLIYVLWSKTCDITRAIEMLELIISKNLMYETDQQYFLNNVLPKISNPEYSSDQFTKALDSELWHRFAVSTSLIQYSHFNRNLRNTVKSLLKWLNISYSKS